MKKRISVIFGTRPEAIKLAPVILALRKHSAIECRVCVTAQHRQMLDQVLDAFGIEPDHDLNLMKRNQTLANFTARALHALEKYLVADQPDLVLVQGDTTTVFCGALAAFYHHIPVAHVEAGLRTWNLEAPWPEEANRVLTSRLAAIHFAPTEWSRNNLLKEGVPADRIHVTGNPVIDALLMARRKVRSHPPTIPELPPAIQPGTRAGDPPLVLITGHRRESFGKGFEQICHAIAQLAKAFPAVQFVYPVHLNPNVRKPVMRILEPFAHTPSVGRKKIQSRDCPPGGRNIHLIEPLDYLPFVGMMDRSSIVLTDSGGIQEEAPSLGKPVFVMRDVTERPEGIAAGSVTLVGTDERVIFREVAQSIREKNACLKFHGQRNPYGDGRAAPRIVRVCEAFLCCKASPARC